MAKRMIIVLLVCAAMISQPTFIGSTSAATDSREIAIEIAKINAQASIYDRAMGEIRRVAGRTLTTREDLQQAIDVLRVQSSRIVNSADKKLASITLQKDSFQQAVFADLDRRFFQPAFSTPSLRTAALKSFRTQLVQSPRQILPTIGGVSQISSELQAALRKDAEAFRRLGSNLSEAANRLRTRAVLEPSQRRFNASYAVHRMQSNDSVEDCDACPGSMTTVGLSLNAEANPVFMQTGVLEAAVIAALGVAVGVIIEKYVEAKIRDFEQGTDPATGNPTPSPQSVCHDKAEAKRDTCLARVAANTSALCKPCDEAVCWAVFASDTAACLLLLQS